jgi:FAD/FMN-containing dehydrogenase/Fe-S oxidoreductase
MNATSVAARDVDLEALAFELTSTTTAEVRFDRTSRAIYATDASNHRQIPLGVVIPRSIGDVIATIAACRRFGAPLLPRGGGTSLAGQTCNVAVVVDMSKYLNRVLEVDPDRMLARVQPGTVLDVLRTAAERHHLTFGPDPATHSRCTLGGMIGNNSCGVHSVMAGKTDENVLSLDVITYRGDRFTVGSLSEPDLDRAITGGGANGAVLGQLRDLRDRYSAEIRSGFVNIPRRVSGFDLPHLLPDRGFNVAGALVGTEGTCVTVLEATLRLVHSPRERSLLVVAFGDIFEAADQVCPILEFGPIGLEGMDHRLIADLVERSMFPEQVDSLPHPPHGPGGWLLVEFGGETHQESESKAQSLMNHLRRLPSPPGMRLCATPAEARSLWEVREAGLGAGALVPGKFMRWAGWDDSAVSPTVMGPYLRDLQKLMDQYDYDGAFYGHFGDGCLHVRYDFDLQTRAGIDKYAAFLSDAADLVVSYGGSLSGEHGDGQTHGELLPKMYSPELMQAFRSFKEIWDPDWKMNPGKVIDPLPMTADIRLEGYTPGPMLTEFRYPNDAGRFSMAALRCVGVGKCRRVDEGGVMCPSYQATGEEMHSTRGRARVLFEMIHGDVITDGWRDEGVRDSLDLCLACKGCKTECPVGVDMATYKAEFLSHFYKRRLRPRAAYTMGLIAWWARLGAMAPRLTNWAGTNIVVSRFLKFVAGVAPSRTLPRYADRTFRRSYSRNADASGSPAAARGRVLLWVDTFNNHFHPEVCEAAVAVLSSAGFAVTIPRAHLCCGRPLYDFGMLTLARRQLTQIMTTLALDIEAGIPIVVLEPSCASVFRDELTNLFPDDTIAQKLSQQTYLLAEFLESHAGNVSWPVLRGNVILQGHCHQTSLLGMRADVTLLEKVGLEVKVVDRGCCGMAGAFGFEPQHYDLSVQIARKAVLPAVQSAAPETWVIADGFSCREQLVQLTDLAPIHLAELLHRAAVTQD